MSGGQYRWLSLFTSLCVGVGFAALWSMDWSSGQAVSKREDEALGSGRYQDYYKNIDYYYYLWGGKEKRFHLSADELHSNMKTKRVVFLNPSGAVHLKKNRKLKYRGKRGHFEGDRETLYLNDDVFFSEGTSNMSCSRAVYAIGRKELKLRGDVKGLTRFRDYQSSIRISSREALAQLLLGKVRYFGKVNGSVDGPRMEEGRLLFASDTLDMDLYRHRLDIVEDVVFKRERLEAHGNRGAVVWNRQSKSIDHYVLHDNVRLKEKVRKKDSDGFFERSALAEKLEGAFDDNWVVLTGRPRVVQLEDVIKGNRIVLKKDSEVVEVDDASAHFRLR